MHTPIQTNPTTPKAKRVELGSPPHGWCHEFLPRDTATERAALAADSSTSSRYYSSYTEHSMGVHRTTSSTTERAALTADSSTSSRYYSSYTEHSMGEHRTTSSTTERAALTADSSTSSRYYSSYTEHSMGEHRTTSSTLSADVCHLDRCARVNLICFVSRELNGFQETDPSASQPRHHGTCCHNI